VLWGKAKRGRFEIEEGAGEMGELVVRTYFLDQE
jgi:hypothetical protein